MKGLRKILWVSWTTKKTGEWVLNKDGVKREPSGTVKARKLAYYGHTTRKQGSCLEKEVMKGTMPGACRRGRPRTAWMDNIKTWTGLPVEESVRVTEVQGQSMSMVWPTLRSRTAEEQNGKNFVLQRFLASFQLPVMHSVYCQFLYMCIVQFFYILGALGVMYREGLGVEKNLNKAFICLKDASSRGNVYAMGQLAAYYYQCKLYTKAMELAGRYVSALLLFVFREH